MTNTQPENVPQTTPSPRFGWVAGVATPYLIFNVVLVTILIASWAFWLPSVTKIDIGGSAKNAAQLRTYQSQLTASILTEEEKRDALVLPVHDASYTALKTARMQSPSLEELTHEIQHAAASVSDQPDAVHVSSIHYVAGEKTVRITGDVRFVGPSSMTVLATFADKVASLPFVAQMTAPKFVREEDGSGGFHSPFDLSITLQ